MRKLHFTDAASENIFAIAEHIAEQASDRETAVRFAAAIWAKCERLASLPGIMGTARPELRPDLRTTPFQNYVIVFRYREEALEIVNVLDGHRDIGRVFAG